MKKISFGFKFNKNYLFLLLVILFLFLNLLSIGYVSYKFNYNFKERRENIEKETEAKSIKNIDPKDFEEINGYFGDRKINYDKSEGLTFREIFF